MFVLYLYNICMYIAGSEPVGIVQASTAGIAGNECPSY